MRRELTLALVRVTSRGRLFAAEIRGMQAAPSGSGGTHVAHREIASGGATSISSRRMIRPTRAIGTQQVQEVARTNIWRKAI